MKTNFIKKLMIGAAASFAAAASLISAGASAEWKPIGYMGDLNGDREITIADAVTMTRFLLGETPLTSANGYDVKGKWIGINGEDGYLSETFLDTADMNRDGKVNIYDLVLLRRHIISNAGHVVWEWEDEPAATTTAPQYGGTGTTTTTARDFIDPPIYDLYGSMPSQGDAKMAVFYVDFPDCRYEFMPQVSDIENAVFGKGSIDDWNYPFESVRAFYSRASKGSMDISGSVYTYTAKNSKSFYENDPWHIELVNEIIAEFDSKVDFSKFDGDKDKVIDSILISVPENAGEDNWWPMAGIFGGETSNRADGMDIGHVIVGNSEIISSADHKNFCSSYCHELGHCMGLPDFYFYNAEDFQGLHGSAGFEMMDDAICDYGAASKLMLGWYTKEQVNIYDKNEGTQTYTLYNGQTDKGNCVIIPCGTLKNKYRSEFFIIENISKAGNNKMLEEEWWRATGSGIRVFHVEATESGDFFYNSFKYQNSNEEETNYGSGRRFIRLIGEGTDNTDNLFHTGDVINSSVSGFFMYDRNDGLTVDPGVVITVGERSGDSYTITISAK